MSHRSPLATADKPATTHTPTGERAQCRDRTSGGDARRAAGREPKEDDVPRHVRRENVAKTQKADRIDEAGDDRQPDERANERRLIVHNAGRRVHEISSQLVYGMRSCSRCGSSPSHAGFCAVPSKMDEVLKGSNSPRAAAVAVLDSNAVNSGSLKGRNVRAAPQAWSRISIESTPVITTDVGRFSA